MHPHTFITFLESRCYTVTYISISDSLRTLDNLETDDPEISGSRLAPVYPSLKLYIRIDCFSSSKLKQLRRLKGKAYKCGEKTQVKKLSVSIKKEIKCLHEKYVYFLIGNPNYRDVWKVIEQLGGLVLKSNQSSINVDRLN